MSDEHPDHDHDHTAPAAGPAPGMPEDAGAQALAEALRSSFWIVRWVMGLLVVLFFASGVFIVGPQEKVVVLRFGAPVGVGNAALKEPGLHASFPYPIDEVVRIPISEIQKVSSTTGWYFTTPDQEFNNIEPPAGPSLNPAQDGYIITGDTNIIHSKVTLSYRIEDPIRFVFDFVSASNAVQSALDNALIYVAAHYRVDDVLRHDVAGFQERVQARVTALAHQQDLGIAIDQCRVESRPPRQVKAVFEKLNTALSTRDKARNDALSYSNQIVSRAESEAVNRTSAAQTERVRLVQTVKAEAERFRNSLPQFHANPALFASLRLNETFSRVLTNVEAKWYLPERTDGKSQELRLLLSREPLKPASAQNP